MAATSGSDAGKLEHRYLHGPADQVLVDEVFETIGGQQVSDEILWQLGDHQGSVRDIMDGNGVVRKHVNYDAFGKITGEQFFGRDGDEIDPTHAEAVEQLFYFQGQQRDAATGLQKHGVRWYDPFTGRWRSTDPSGLGPDANLYRYVHNNPVIYVDPSGLVQAGNPLNNLFGSYNNPYITSANNGSLNLGTLGKVLGNSVINAASSYLGPAGRSTTTAGLLVAGSFPTIGQTSATANERYITKFGGQSIPAQQQGDLPIRAQQVIKQPNSYLVSPHQNQGYFIADPSGAVHFMNNEEVLPTLTLMDRARSEANASRDLSRLIGIAGNIAAMPADTFRDLYEAGSGHDWVDPNQRLTAHDRATSLFLGAVPGVSGSQVRQADQLLDALQNVRRAKGGTYILLDAESEQIMRSGRTNDLARRKGEHGRNPDLKDFEFRPVHQTDDYAAQRGLEQELHWRYNPPLNYRRPIDPRNPNLQDYLRAANDALDGYDP